MYPMKRECVLFDQLSNTILHWIGVTESRDTEALEEKHFQRHDYTKIEEEVESMKRSPSLLYAAKQNECRPSQKKKISANKANKGKAAGFMPPLYHKPAEHLWTNRIKTIIIQIFHQSNVHSKINLYSVQIYSMYFTWETHYLGKNFVPEVTLLGF